MHEQRVERMVDDRRGIALVVVLGFLSILILMAVALVTLTRTERLVAATSLEGTRAKVLARGAVGAAMNELNREFWPAQRIHASKDRAVFESQGTGGKVGGGLDILGGEATNWLPRKYAASTDIDYDLAGIWNNDAEWVLVRDPTNLTTGTILGRYAFLAMDCTGLLDANLIAEPDVTGVYANQSVRNNVRQVPVDSLPEAIVPPPAFETSRRLIANRLNYHGFATFREITVFNDGLNVGFPFPELEAINETNLNSLAPFSLSYDAGWWDWTVDEWKRGMPGSRENVKEWEAADAQNAFQNLLGVDAATALQMGQAFEDYKDPDRVPLNVLSFCTEAAPMLNEFIVSGSVDTDAGGIVSITVQVQAETWYPFPSRTPLTGYNFGVDEPTMAGTPGPRNLLCVVVAPGIGAIPYVSPPPAPVALNAISYNDGNPQLHPPLVYIIPNLPVVTGTSLQIGFRIQSVSLYDSDGAEVDRAVIGTVPMVFTVATVPAAGGSAAFVPGAFSVEVSDPRLNHISTSWGAAGAGTPGALNTAGTLERTIEGSMMFVRDAPLESVAELGYISTGAVWGTVGLYTRGGRELLARFRATNSAARVWTNGCLNPNTLFPGTLSAAFYGVNSAEVPELDVPAMPAVQLWTDTAQIGWLADAMYQQSQNTSNTGTNSFDSAAGWVTVNVMQPGQALAVAGLNNNQREAIIRNSYRMFTPTENLYTVFVVAQTVADGDTSIVTGEKRAVALVWRDPFPNTDGRHEWFIRQFKWLDD